MSANILNEQPLTADALYTLIVRSEPNSIDWEGNIKINDMALEVPSWFSLEEGKCSFTGDTDSAARVKRLKLTENARRQLEMCEGSNIEVSTGCNFFCDFRVQGKEELDNIEEYNIRVLQVTNYTLNKSTTFGFMKTVFEKKDEEAEEAEEEENTRDTGVIGGPPSDDTNAQEPVQDEANGENNDKPVCGNGVVEATLGEGDDTNAEQCDDGNSESNDGCGVGCKIEEGWDCTLTNPSICTKNE